MVRMNATLIERHQDSRVTSSVETMKGEDGDRKQVCTRFGACPSVFLVSSRPNRDLRSGPTGSQVRRVECGVPKVGIPHPQRRNDERCRSDER